MLQVAAVALGLAGIANLPAMMNELMGEGDPSILRQNLHKFLLDLLRGLRFGKSQPPRDAKNMCIHNDTLCLAEANSKNYIGSLAGRAGNGNELG